MLRSAKRSQRRAPSILKRVDKVYERPSRASKPADDDGVNLSPLGRFDQLFFLAKGGLSPRSARLRLPWRWSILSSWHSSASPIVASEAFAGRVSRHGHKARREPSSLSKYPHESAERNRCFFQGFGDAITVCPETIVSGQPGHHHHSRACSHY